MAGSNRAGHPAPIRHRFGLPERRELCEKRQYLTDDADPPAAAGGRDCASRPKRSANDGDLDRLLDRSRTRSIGCNHESLCGGGVRGSCDVGNRRPGAARPFARQLSSRGGSQAIEKRGSAAGNPVRGTCFAGAVRWITHRPTDAQ
jgi:hypothetical protein